MLEFLELVLVADGHGTALLLASYGVSIRRHERARQRASRANSWWSSDKTEESRVALRFASRRAKHTVDG